MILESIVTTVGTDGRVNIAPMGPVVDGLSFRQFLLRPFESSQTFANLMASRHAVVHVTDDASLFARAAVGKIKSAGLVQPLDAEKQFFRLNDCHRWFALDVVSVSEDRPRAEMVCRVVSSGVVRPFFGFNRAKHAIIEAAILATRTHLLPASEIHSQLAALVPLVEKTGSDADRDVFAVLVDQIHQRLRSESTELVEKPAAETRR